MAITKRQHQVYDFIRKFVEERGYSPSFEEIGRGMRLSSLATVHKHVSNLDKKLTCCPCARARVPSRMGKRCRS